MNEKLKILFDWGETSHGLDWPDYLQHGFDESDVPDLLELVQDTSLNNADGNSNEVWVPLYAWRILGQLQAEQAVQPLIALYDDLVGDDWVGEELPVVMGMIGEPALEPLVAYLQETHHEEFARAIAMVGLEKIAEYNSDLRGRVIERFSRYMTAPDTSAFFLNGLLMGCLIHLDAKEVIEDIRSLFEKDCVDISCAGDLEEVEIALELRMSRSTPKPDYSQEMTGLSELLSDLTPELLPEKPDGDNLYELADYYLIKYGNDDSVLDISELDGFFTALACAPETILPSIWFPAMWGGKALIPEWETKKDVEEFNQLIFILYNHVMEGMDESDYEALFLERTIDEKNYLIVDEWCEGFLRGINLWGPLAAMDAKFLAEQLLPVRLFATESGWGQRDEMDEEQIEKQQKLIEPNVRRLYDYFLKQRRKERQPLVRNKPKVGRNEPCPCGSGKKYKKCCGLH